MKLVKMIIFERSIWIVAEFEPMLDPPASRDLMKGHFWPNRVIFCSHGRDEILFTGFRIAFWHFENKHSEFFEIFEIFWNFLDCVGFIISSNMLSSTCFQSTRLVVYLALVIVYASLHKKYSQNDRFRWKISN